MIACLLKFNYGQARQTTTFAPNLVPACPPQADWIKREVRLESGAIPVAVRHLVNSE